MQLIQLPLNLSKQHRGVETLEQRFQRFHCENPHVYRELVRLARQAKDRGCRKIGIGMLWEVMRWNFTISTEGDAYKLNNSYRSRYARLVMEREPSLQDIFETRELKS